MSRRATLFLLGASAALIATQASAAPKCVGENCANAPTEAQLRSQSQSAQGETPVARHGHFRHVRPYPNGYVVGAPVAFGPVAVASPPFIYGGYGYGAYVGRPVYLFAPNAKIITLDRD